MLAYSTSKAGVIGLTKVIGKEYAEAGDITCNAVAPVSSFLSVFGTIHHSLSCHFHSQQAVVRTEMVAAMPAQQVRHRCYTHRIFSLKNDYVPKRATG